jgi:hypothetical protein
VTNVALNIQPNQENGTRNEYNHNSHSESRRDLAIAFSNKDQWLSVFESAFTHLKEQAKPLLEICDGNCVRRRVITAPPGFHY